MLTQALRDGGKAIITDAKSRAPRASEPHFVGKGKELVQPGNIARNIMIRRVKSTDAAATVSIGVRAGGKKSGKDAFYWRFLEFGTKFISARPFMRPAFESKKYQVAETIKDALRRRIDAAVIKLGGKSI